MNIKKVTMTPKGSADIVRSSICSIGAGIIVNYSYCTTSAKCIGTFKANNNTNSYIGKKMN